MGRPRLEIDLAQLEELARAGRKPARAATALGLEPATLYYRLRHDEAVRAAWARGLARQREVSGLTEIGVAASAGAADRLLVIRQDVLAAVAAGLRTRREIRERTAHSYSDINLALYALEVGERAVCGREDAAGIRRYYLAGEPSYEEEPRPAPPPPPGADVPLSA